MLLLYVALAGALAVGAQALRARRDLGSGLFPARPGPAHGSPRLADVLALTWRVHQPALLGWTVGVLALGAVMGAIAPGVGDLLDTEAGRRLIESIGGTGTLEDCPARRRPVDRGGRDHLLRDRRGTPGGAPTSTTAAPSRCWPPPPPGAGHSWPRSWWPWAVSAWLLAADRARPPASASGGDIGGLVEAGLAQLPAVWLVLGLAALLYAVRSRWAVAAWGLLGVFLVLGQIGSLLELPGWVTGLSPYEHVPAMPVESFRAAPAAGPDRDRGRAALAPRGGATGAATSVSFRPCGSPSRAGSRCPAAPGRPPWACGGPSSVAVRSP